MKQMLEESVIIETDDRWRFPSFLSIFSELIIGEDGQLQAFLMPQQKNISHYDD